MDVPHGCGDGPMKFPEKTSPGSPGLVSGKRLPRSEHPSKRRAATPRPMAQVLQGLFRRWRRALEAPPLALLLFARRVLLALSLRGIIRLHERGHPLPVGHRAGRLARRRATLAARLRRAAQAGGRTTGPREAG